MYCTKKVKKEKVNSRKNRADQNGIEMNRIEASRTEIGWMTLPHCCRCCYCCNSKYSKHSSRKTPNERLQPEKRATQCILADTMKKEKGQQVMVELLGAEVGTFSIQKQTQSTNERETVCGKPTDHRTQYRI